MKRAAHVVLGVAPNASKEDVRAAYLWYSSYSGPRDNISALFMKWLSAHMITNKVVGCAFTAVGCVALLFWPAVINVAMVLGLAPVIGVPLPLFSYGGSALLANLATIGLLLNISMRRYMF